MQFCSSSLINLIANFYLMIQHDAANLRLFNCIGHTGFVFQCKDKRALTYQPCLDGFCNTTPLLWCICSLDWDKVTPSGSNENPSTARDSPPPVQPEGSVAHHLVWLRFIAAQFHRPPLLHAPSSVLFSSAYLDPPQHLSNFNHSSYGEIGDPGQRRQRTRRMERLSADTTGNRALG